MAAHFHFSGASDSLYALNGLRIASPSSKYFIIFKRTIETTPTIVMKLFAPFLAILSMAALASASPEEHDRELSGRKRPGRYVSSKYFRDTIGSRHSLTRMKYYRQVAELGPRGRFGRFWMTTSANDGVMSWRVSLRQIKKLEYHLRKLGDLAEDQSITSLNYHLHQSWNTTESDYGIGGAACGPSITGGHYDPYLGCGPASGQSTERCAAIDRERSSDRYSCSGAYDVHEYDRCEVGDLSGKYGPVVINPKGRRANKRAVRDPLPALDWHFMEATGDATPEQFASIVFHLGSPRVLCARIKKVY